MKTTLKVDDAPLAEAERPAAIVETVLMRAGLDTLIARERSANEEAST